jgi:hypothetical protein
MSHRAAIWLPWSLWSLSLALTVLSLLLLTLNLSHPGTHIFDWWLGNALVVIDATVGAIVASRRPENPVGWLLCLSGVAVSISSFTSQYAIYALLARPDSTPAGEAVAWIAAWLLPIMIGLQVFYLLLFPTGRLPSRVRDPETSPSFAVWSSARSRRDSHVNGGARKRRYTRRASS